MEIIKGFFGDSRVMTILGLILLDVLLAVAAALRTGQFEPKRLADFYRTMVVPYVIGYLAFYLVSTYFIKDVELLGPYADVVGEGMVWMAWLALVGTLGAAVFKNVKALAYKIPDEP